MGTWAKATKQSSKMVVGQKHCYVCDTDKVGREGFSKHMNSHSDELKKFRFSNNTRDCCRTACKICGSVFPLSRMREHTKSVHQLQIGEYKAKYQQTFFDIEEKVFHRCGVCSLPLLLDSDVIASHLNGNKASHNLSHGEYNKTYMQTAHSRGSFVGPSRAKVVSPSSVSTAKGVSPSSVSKANIVSPSSVSKTKLAAPVSAKVVSPSSTKVAPPSSAKVVSPSSAKVLAPSSAKVVPRSSVSKAKVVTSSSVKPASVVGASVVDSLTSIYPMVKVTAVQEVTRQETVAEEKVVQQLMEVDMEDMEVDTTLDTTLDTTELDILGDDDGDVEEKVDQEQLRLTIKEFRELVTNIHSNEPPQSYPTIEMLLKMDSYSEEDTLDTLKYYSKNGLL